MSDYLTNTQMIFEQVQTLITPLSVASAANAEERLALIQAIAATPPSTSPLALPIGETS